MAIRQVHSLIIHRYKLSGRWYNIFELIRQLTIKAAAGLKPSTP